MWRSNRRSSKPYQRLKENKGKDDPIYFMDGVHPRHNPVAAYGWIKRGTHKTMESNTGRSRVNINGAVDVAHLKVVVEFGEAVNAQSTIALLRGGWKPDTREPRRSMFIVTMLATIALVWCRRILWGLRSN